MKKMKLIIFYENGDIHEFIQEGTEEQFESIASVVNESFKGGVDAVIRLNNDNTSNMIRLSSVLRVLFEDLDKGVKENHE